MYALQTYGVAELPGAELARIGGGTGSGELAHDLGLVVGVVVGAFFLLGKALYENGGLFGTMD